MKHYLLVTTVLRSIGAPAAAIVVAAAFSVAVPIFAQEDGTSSPANRSEKICQSLDRIDSTCETLSRDACESLLEKCKGFYEEQAEEYKDTVQQKESRERTFEEQVAHFNRRINQLDSRIRQNRLQIKDLNFQIEDTTESIGKTEKRIAQNEELLADILQIIYEKDQRSEIAVLLSGEGFTSFFQNLAALESLQGKNREVLEEVRSLHENLVQQKKDLASEKEKLQRVTIQTRIQREESEEIKQRKQELLAEVRGEKQQYQQYLQDAQKKAAEIRQRIFELAQVPTNEAPTLEEAYQLAKSAGAQTNVRPALLLGLFSVESAIGENVGQCNCPPGDNCRHPDLGWKEVMRKNQWSDFKTITENLGLDRDTTPVSCSVSGGQVQWGGAMGPAQFIPSTWMEYRDRLQDKIGETPDPWNIKHAFTAAGLYLADYGATSQQYNDEIGAATAYLCGTTRMTRRCQQARGEWYRQEVMSKAQEFQDFIDRGVLR